MKQRSLQRSGIGKGPLLHKRRSEPHMLMPFGTAHHPSGIQKSWGLWPKPFSMASRRQWGSRPSSWWGMWGTMVSLVPPGDPSPHPPLYPMNLTVFRFASQSFSASNPVTKDFKKAQGAAWAAWQEYVAAEFSMWPSAYIH